MHKILVTGGAGFIGRHFVSRFLRNGDEVYCVDCIAAFTGAIHPKNGWPDIKPMDYPNFHFYEEDCRSYFARVNDRDFDYALHLAAMVGGRLMIENQPLAVAQDLAIDADYWKWATLARPKKSICFSSSAAYPVKLQTEKKYALLEETMIDFQSDIGVPDMSYGWSKLTCEYLAKIAYEKHELKSVIYRPFSVYGTDQNDAYPFPSICKRAIANANKPILKIWGSGRQMRDFIHVDDCVDFVLETMDKIENADALNLSSGILTSIQDLARTAADVCGYMPKVVGDSNKPMGVFARGGDTTKQLAFGLIPKISLRAGIERAVTHYQNLTNGTAALRLNEPHATASRIRRSAGHL